VTERQAERVHELEHLADELMCDIYRRYYGTRTGIIPSMDQVSWDIGKLSSMISLLLAELKVLQLPQVTVHPENNQRDNGPD